MKRTSQTSPTPAKLVARLAKILKTHHTSNSGVWISNIDYDPTYGYRVIMIDRKRDLVHRGENMNLAYALNQAIAACESYE